jgi:hypothetical protein
LGTYNQYNTDGSRCQPDSHDSHPTSRLLQSPRGSILSSRSVAKAYRRVRLEQRIWANLHPSIRLPLQFSLLGMLVKRLCNSPTPHIGQWHLKSASSNMSF